MTAIISPVPELSALRSRPEHELLLYCSCTCIKSQDVERISLLLKQGMHWDYLVETARQQGVMPLLYWNLSNTFPDAMPDMLLSQLRTSFEKNAASNLCLTGELLNLLHLFQENAIPAIPFKGPILTTSVYGNLALRQFCDLDILVREQDVEHAEELLVVQGYRLISDLLWQKQWVNVDTGVNVDLHQAVAPKDFPLLLDFETLWERLEPVSVNGETVLSLSTEDLLLILCTNVARDCWQNRGRLIQICDIAELLRVHSEIDWHQLLEQSRRLGCERMLLLSLLLAQELFGIRLPEEVLLRMRAKPVLQSLALQVCKWLFCEIDSSSKGIEQKRFYFRVRERLWDTLPYLIHLAHLWITPSPKDRKFIQLPVFLSLLYYFIRPIRLMGKYGLRLVKSLWFSQHH